jgi:uncharacterized FAD-dependent dehydrogenase
MIKEITITLLPIEVNNDELIRCKIRETLSLKTSDILQFEKLKQSIDARSRTIIILLKTRVYINEKIIDHDALNQFDFLDVIHKKSVVIIGAGPAGLFCALQLLQLGIKPIIIERGKKVRERRRDLALLNKEGILNEESNYCFGEGGAGTYSDGKLYTRSNKRGSIDSILKMFHYFGAEKNILYEAHPHIGTNKLPQIIESMREKIIACGGDILFNTKLTDIIYNNKKINSIQVNNQDVIECTQLVLATGHSARDIYTLLHQKNIHIESKPFALGVRIEHPQTLINQIQYRGNMTEHLPPASYSLVQQVNGQGVFSFCMCPGGVIAPASTQQGGVVVNGWSPSKRNNPFANSGMVVAVNDEDFKPYEKFGELKAMHYQNAVEEKCYEVAGKNYTAPAQRLQDFLENKTSTTLPINSYLRGTTSCNLTDVLPAKIHTHLSEALKQFGKKYKGYVTNEAILVATESRTSSPIKIPRDETLQHPQLKGLYPCAEGAGYAGGIVSAAMDGIRIAEQIAITM